MAFSYNVDTYAKARKAAEQAYGIIPQVNASLARKLPKDREEAIEYLTEQIWPVVQKEYPKDKFDENMAAELASSKDDDWFKMWYLGDSKYSPRVQAKQETFNKFQDLVVDGKWYNMPNRELDLKMSELGYDPNNQESRKQFLDVLSQHDINYNRGKIVDETMQGKSTESIFPDKLPDSPALVQKLALSAYPAMTKEASRQALTGDFDDGKMIRASIADVLAGGTMAVAPSFNVLSSPLKSGIAASVAETARQVIQPTEQPIEDSVADVVLAGTTAGTVPAGGQYIQGMLSKGASTGARRYGRAFARGLRGADDPLMQERNALKQLLIDARKQSVSTADKPYTTGSTWYSSEASPQELANARKWSDAETKLNALGFNTERKYNALSDNIKAADKNLKAAMKAEREAILAKPKSRNKEVQLDYQENVRMYEQIREDAQTAYENALKDMDAYDNSVTVTKYGDELAVEDVIGQNPMTVNAGPVVAYRTPKKNGIEAALKAYDRPMVFGGGVSRAPGMDEANLSSFTSMENRYKTEFPEAYQQSLLYGYKNTKNNRALKSALLAGRVAGGVFGRMEPNVGSIATLLTGGNVGQKVTRFRETDWYKNLPKEKKNAIEKALKGED